MSKYSAPLTAAQAEELGDDVGRIVAFTARALNREFPNLSLESLAEAFTRPLVLESTALRYLAALENGATPGDAAGQAGAALIETWADARLRAAEITATT
ncbi:hypothetical protein [Streptomyces anulatus]|uniref:hypothetical protein n=1 Tax=Streptomyces anulatus TaxID=1892 RepID=UPI003649727B